MNQSIHIELLGHLTVVHDQTQVTRFRTQKTGVLLGYLALFLHRRHPREELIELLWPDVDLEAGRTSLRTALASLRRQLEPPHLPANSILLADRTNVQLNPGLVHTDVMAFESALHRIPNTAPAALKIETLSAAINHYSGPLLPGFYEDWALRERERLQQVYTGALRTLVDVLHSQQEIAQALAYAQRLLAAAPLDEETHLALMRLYAESGQTSAVKRQFQEWEQIAERELGDTPSRAARLLLTQLTEDNCRPSVSALPSVASTPVTPALIAPAGSPPPLASPASMAPPGGSSPGESPSAPLPSVSAPPLPRHLTRFFGREHEKAQIEGWLSGGHTRLLTLTGMGGSGKTRLALEAAAALAPHFAQAVWFVPLADVTDVSRVAEAIARTLGLQPVVGVSALEQCKTFLASRPALLVLDNFEHLPEEAALLVQTLLHQLPALRCLVTSRQPLGLSGEQECPVSPLPVPQTGRPGDKETRRQGEERPDEEIPARLPTAVQTPPLASEANVPASSATRPFSLSPCLPVSLSSLLAYPSVQLFVDRARAVRPDFALTAHNAPTIAELCARLEGIPLALELTAAWASLLTPGQMLARLERRFDLLTTRRKDLPPRHRTLRATVEWSYRLLTPEQQAFFAGLSVFQGGCTIEAAEAVCEQPDALEFMQQLQERSLVLPEEQDGEMRFRLLETLRDYAQEQLTESDHRRLQRRHHDFCVHFAEQAAPYLHGAEQHRWLDRLEKESDNLRAALDLCTSHAECVESGLRLAVALWWFWRIRGHWRRGRDRLLQLLGQAEPQSPLRGQALYAAGCLSGVLTDYSLACRLLEQSLELARQGEDTQGIGDALHALGNVALDQGDVPMARACLEESLALRRRTGDMPRISSSLLMLGNLELTRNLDIARSYYEQSLAIRRQIGDQKGISAALNNLGEVARDQGHYQKARVFYEESLRISQELGDKWGISTALGNLGVVAMEQGDYETTRELLTQSLDMARELREQRGVASTLANLGVLASHLSDYQMAQSLYEQSLTLHRELGDRWGVVMALRNMGNLAADQGRYAEARALQEQSLALAREQGDKHGMAMSLYNLGELAWYRGDPTEARRMWEECLLLDQEIGVKGGSILGGLAQVAQGEGDFAEAHRLWSRSLAEHQEIGDRKGVAECLEGLAYLAAACASSARAAHLFGAASRLRETLKAPLPPGLCPRYEQALADLRAALTASEFQTHWEKGRASLLEDTLVFAANPTEAAATGS